MVVVSVVQFETAAGNHRSRALQQLQDYRKLNIDYFLKVWTCTECQAWLPIAANACQADGVQFHLAIVFRLKWHLQ
jgi:hypothetical protein